MKFEVLESRYDALCKKVKAVQRKLAKQNLELTFNELSRDLVQLPVYSADDDRVHIGNVIVSVVTYEFDMPHFVIGDWEPVAVIEHDAVTADGNRFNVVKPIVADADFYNTEDYQMWRTIRSGCDHCNHMRKRKYTVILKDRTDGESYKQVGSTCVRDFTGIDAWDIVHEYAAIADIILQEADMDSLVATGSLSGQNDKYSSTRDYLAHCIIEIEKHGYLKTDSHSARDTKHYAWAALKQEMYLAAPAYARFLALADTVIEFFTGTEFPEHPLLADIQKCLYAEFTTISGRIAYAYPAYLRELEKPTGPSGEYVGEIGKPVICEVQYLNSYIVCGYYGDSFVHNFKDGCGNRLKWITKAVLPKWVVNGESTMFTITGTVKSQEEYQGTKETLLIRCKFAA